MERIKAEWRNVVVLKKNNGHKVFWSGSDFEIYNAPETFMTEGDALVALYIAQCMYPLDEVYLSRAVVTVPIE